MYQQEYQRKRISMDQLLELFQSDLFIVLGSGPQSPVGLLSRLHELQGRASHIRLSTALPLKPYPVMTDPNTGNPGAGELLLQPGPAHFRPVGRVHPSPLSSARRTFRGAARPRRPGSAGHLRLPHG